MKTRFLRLTISVTVLVLTLSGCSLGSNANVDELNSLAPNVDGASLSDVNGGLSGMSVTERDEQIYEQVSSRQLLDLGSLNKADDASVSSVTSYMNKVNACIVSGSGADTDTNSTDSAQADVIDSCYVNYLLWEFEKTPYYWQRSQMIVEGVDSVSGDVVVDVVYHTVGTKKIVKPAVMICKGSEGYAEAMTDRYTLWVDILNTKFGGDASYSDLSTSTDLNTLIKNFTKKYGNIDDIIASQTSDNLMYNVSVTGNQSTYEGLVDSTCEDSPATMTVRFVLVPVCAMGMNLGYECKHMYVTDYSQTKGEPDAQELTGDQTFELDNEIKSFLNSYCKCIDESDYTGLYKLSANFASYEGYCDDMFNFAYQKHVGCTYKILSIDGMKVQAEVVSNLELRAKGSNMTFPLYEETALVTLDFTTGELKLTDWVVLSRKLVGEPQINVQNTTLSSTVNLSDGDEASINSLIGNFALLQVEEDTTSTDFSKTVDTSLSESQMSAITTSMGLMTDVTDKSVWLMSYMQGGKGYVSLRCRELYKKSDDSVWEATSVYSFISKGGSWYVYDYEIESLIESVSGYDTKGALCYVSDGALTLATDTSEVTPTPAQEATVNANALVVGYDEEKIDIHKTTDTESSQLGVEASPKEDDTSATDSAGGSSFALDNLQ